MTPFAWILIVFLIVTFLEIITVLIIFRKNISSFFNPSMWAEVEMIELDNNVLSWLQKKSADLKFTFNKGNYYLFNPSSSTTLDTTLKGNSIPLPPPLKKDITPIFRSGRLPKYYYQEGNPFPLNITLEDRTINTQIDTQIQSLEIGKAFRVDEGLSWEILKKYGIFILIIIIVLLFILLSKNS